MTFLKIKNKCKTILDALKKCLKYIYIFCNVFIIFELNAYLNKDENVNEISNNN